MEPSDVEHEYQAAVEHHKAGRLVDAELGYREVLARQPRHVNALYRLGVLAGQCGNPTVAIDYLLKAVAINANAWEYHTNLAKAFNDLQKPAYAVTACEKALKLSPGNPHTLNQLGNAYLAQARLDDADRALQQALGSAPKNFEIYCNLGNVAKARGDVARAIALYEQSIAMEPKFATGYHNVGKIYADVRRDADAERAYRKAIELEPSFALAYASLGVSLQLRGEFEEAASLFRIAMSMKADMPELLNNYGNFLKDSGDLDGAVEHLRKGISICPSGAYLRSNLILTMHYHPAYDARAIKRECQQWDADFAAPVVGQIRPHDNNRDPLRHLRIGYVSPDFRDHAVGANVFPLVRDRDPSQVEVFCYSSVKNEDAITDKYRRLADGWRDISNTIDEQAAALIREDKIDILVDLTLHTGGHRLGVFALKPAPVQMTFAGYPGGTGVQAIDYRISDSYLDPPDQIKGHYTEKTVYLPSFWCYDPEAMAVSTRLMPGPLPAIRNGYITFGSLNAACKVTWPAVDLWSKVLLAVPRSRLRLLIGAPAQRASIQERLKRNGVDAGRVEFLPRMPREQYRLQYQKVDIGLDTLPYNGHTTSLESFWMGVPVITLVGDRAWARAGWSQLNNLNLAELGAFEESAFVEIARALAEDQPRLKELRAGLRQRMSESVLSNGRRFASNMERIYRAVWHTWIQSTGSEL